MVDEAESLPHPIILDHGQLHVWPDHGGMQHSEVFATRDRLLWWVPSWMPASIRDGWRVGLRRATGSPMHPSVFARFAQDVVDLATGPGRYRPACLGDDERFAWHRGVEPAGAADARRELGTSIFRVAGDDPVEFRVSDAVDDVRAGLAGLGAENGVVIPTGAWLVADRDPYRDGLSHDFVADEMARSSHAVRPVEIRPPSNPLSARGGWFVGGVDMVRARSLAAFGGQPFLLVISPDGVSVADTWPGA